MSPISLINETGCRAMMIAERFYYDSGTGGCSKVTHRDCWTKDVGGYRSQEECLRMCVPAIRSKFTNVNLG